MARMRKLALLAAAAEAARRYAQKNPDKAGKLLDQAAGFVNKQTKGKYSGQIDGAARKAKGVAGIPTDPGYGTPGGYQPPAGNGQSGYTPPTYPSTPQDRSAP